MKANPMEEELANLDAAVVEAATVWALTRSGSINGELVASRELVAAVMARLRRIAEIETEETTVRWGYFAAPAAAPHESVQRHAAESRHQWRLHERTFPVFHDTVWWACLYRRLRDGTIVDVQVGVRVEAKGAA